MRRFSLFAAVALMAAAPAMAGSYRMMFDIFSPAGITCEASPPPGGAVRITRGLFTGNPVVAIDGAPLREAEITCTLPDGSRWQAIAHQTLRPGTMRADGLVAIRPGARAGVTVMSIDGRDDVAMRSFLPLP